jgi:hypothetical protein
LVIIKRDKSAPMEERKVATFEMADLTTSEAKAALPELEIAVV